MNSSCGGAGWVAGKEQLSLLLYIYLLSLLVLSTLFSTYTLDKISKTIIFPTSILYISV